MALFVIVTGLPGEMMTPYAIVADDARATYVHITDPAPEGLDDARVERLAERAERPIDAEGWLSLAASNLGYVQISEAVEVPTIEQGIEQARAAAIGTDPMNGMGGGPGSEDRADVLDHQAWAYETWLVSYPDDPEPGTNPDADLALVQLMTPPVDPEQQHDWLPLVLGDTECGFCELEANAPIHARNTDTMTPGTQ